MLLRRATYAAAAFPLLASTAALAADIPGDNSTRARLQVRNANVSGAWERSGDRDWYRVQLARGESYIVSLSAFNDSLPAPWTYDGVLRDPAGRALATIRSRTDSTDFPIIQLTAERSGTYFVDVGARATRPRQPGIEYFVSVAPDCAASGRTTCRLRPGVEQSRALIGPSDVDWFRVALQAGRPYTVEVAINLDAPSLELVDVNGRRVAQGQPTADGGLVIQGFQPTRTGDYFAVVSGRSDDFTSAGYSIVLRNP